MTVFRVQLVGPNCGPLLHPPKLINYTADPFLEKESRNGFCQTQTINDWTGTETARESFIKICHKY